MEIKKIIKIFALEPEYFLRHIFPQIKCIINNSLSDFTSGKSFALKRLLIILTGKCNLRCRMCSLYGELGLIKSNPPSFLKEDLKFKDVKKIIDDVYLDKPSIILTGGEPLLNKDWHKIAKYIKEKNLRLFLATGGTQLSDFANELVETISHLQISLDGPNENIHDQSRGAGGSFTKILTGIEKIAKIKKDKRQKKPYINICFTINNINYKYLLDLVKFLNSLGIEFNELAFQHLEFTDEETLKKHGELYKNIFQRETDFWSGFLYQPKEMNVNYLIEDIKNIKNKKVKNIREITFRPDLKIEEIEDYYKSNLIPKRFQKKCLAPWNEAFILPDGNVWSCADYICGNIKKENFKDIWNNEKYKKLRRYLIKEKFFPICKTCASLYVY